MADAREFNSIDALAEYRDQWRQLLDRTEKPSFFQSFEWLEVYWRHFGSGQKLRVLVTYDNGQPTGLLPLVVLREKTRVGWVRVLTYPLHDWGTYYGPIGPNLQATLQIGLDYLRRSPRDWDILELRWVHPDTPVFEATAVCVRAAGFQGYKTLWDRTAVAELSGTWQEYLDRRPAKWRSNLRRAERRLRQRGRLTIVHWRPSQLAGDDGSPRWDLYDACEQIASRSWQADCATGTTLSHPSVRPFLRDVHQAACKAGAVDLHVLYLDGQPVSFAYNYQWRGRVEGLRIGYDPAISRDGAGNLLLAKAVEASFQRADWLYDLGVGSLRSKRYFATRIVPVYRYSHFAPGVGRIQIVRLKRCWQARFAGWL